MDPDGSTNNPGTTAALAGGALILLGSMLNWAKLVTNMTGSGSKREALSGMAAGDGKITLALGAVVIAVAAASIVVKQKGGLGTALAVVSIAAGGFASTLSVMFAIDIRTHAIDFVVTQAGQDLDNFAAPARQILDQATAVTSGWGLFLVILGGIVAVVGGVLATVSLRHGLLRAAMADRPGESAETVEEPPTATEG